MEALVGIFGGMGGDLYLWVAGIAGTLLAFVGVYFKGASNAKKNFKLDDLGGALNIKEKADESRKNSAADERSGDERLHEHNRIED